ncbi:glycosyltransferase family 4 protein [Desulfogranum marinum]|uniref:glycosyltransferase family 4 protein n=1 Tax=Desulfogranum marinum TaxID=453220 RepID=UPI0029C6971C|nr:glycosyltransferase family 4 protein [Desulfogranum marinum]
MKIVYLHQYFNTPLMAGGTRSYEMARRLVEAGHEVHIVTSFRKEHEKKGWFRTIEAGIHVHWLPEPYNNKMNFYARIKAFLNFAVKAGLYASRLQADVVFATSTPLTIALPAAFAARRQGVSMVFEVRDLWPELPIAIGALRNPFLKLLAKKLEMFAYRNAKHIVALSPGMAAGVEATGYPVKKISCIPNSCDLHLFKPEKRKAQVFREEHPELGAGPIILYPGTLGRINGVGYLAELASKVRTVRPDCRFVVIGAGIEWEDVQLLASDLGVLGKNFFMYMEIPKTKLVEAFCAATVIVSLVIDLPELEANCANKFFDSLASGTPIAINYKGWQAELIDEYEVGVSLSRDLDVAAKDLVRFIAAEERVHDCGENALKLASAQFDRDVLAGRLEKVLLSAVVDDC